MEFFSMKQQKLSEISRASGKSVSTVSKVLRGCGGVDAETRTHILCTAADMRGSAGELTGNDIFVILPDNPKYFWKKACGAIRQSEIPVTLRLIAAISREQGEALLAHYISEAEASGARALILAAHLSDRLKQRLELLAQRMLVIQLCEYEPISNTFFVGSNGVQDGRALASCISTDPTRPLNVGVLRGAVSHTGVARTEGFLQGLPAEVRLFYVEKPSTAELYASHLARAIDALGVPLDYLFCFDGLTTPACDALYKLRNQMQTRLIGFEYPPTAEKHVAAGRIAALAVQAPDEQTRLALSMAERYVRHRCFPDEKYCYVPSVILQMNERKE
jgi:DNA-binding LacI/PurR family transcriptional regulator